MLSKPESEDRPFNPEQILTYYQIRKSAGLGAKDLDSESSSRRFKIEKSFEPEVWEEYQKNIQNFFTSTTSSEESSTKGIKDFFKKHYADPKEAEIALGRAIGVTVGFSEKEKFKEQLLNQLYTTPIH